MTSRPPGRRTLRGAIGLGLALGAAAVLPAPSAMGAAAAPAAVSEDTLLAVFVGGNVTPTDFIRGWQNLVPSERPKAPSRIAQKREYLHRIVDRKLLALQAARTPLVLTAEEEGEIERTRRQLIQNELFMQFAANLPAPTPADLERFRRQQSQLAEVRFITFTEWDAANSWRRRLLTGTPMSALDDLIQRGGPTAPQAEEFRWVAADQIPDTLAQVLFAMRPGQVSEVHSFAGHPVLLHLRAYMARPGASAQSSTDLGLQEDYRRHQFDRIRQRIRLDLAAAAQREFVEEGMAVLLEGYLRVPSRSGVDSITGTPMMRPNLPLPVFTAADTGLIVARTRHGETNLVSYLRYWQRLPAYARPEVRERAVLEATVDRVVLEPELLEMAGARNLDRNPAVQEELDHMREGYALERYFQANIQARISTDEPSLRKYFDAKPGHYDDPELLEASIIMVDRKELADSLLQAIRGGYSFADLAKQFSLDANSAAKGGVTGPIRRGANSNAGLEDAMFATPPGSLGGPERTPEGWVIWRAGKHTPALERSFEQAREWVERDYRIVEGDRQLDLVLTRLREEAKVRYFDERVTETLGAGGAWGD